MEFALKDIIFDLFGNTDRAADMYKDSNGRGLHQRFLELLAGDLDDNELNLANNFVANTQDPRTVLERFLSYREQTFGGLLNLGSDATIRRKVLKFESWLNRLRGTRTGYSVAFNMLGFDSSNIVEIDYNSGFDSPVTFDDTIRRFDMKCFACSRYRIELTGSLVINDSILLSIGNIITFNQPINAKLDAVLYNGVDILDDLLREYTLEYTLEFI